jgi:hypothetical protein
VISDIDPSLEEHYRKLESALPVTNSGNYATLVTPNGNSTEPIHRWFHFKEAFSHRLVHRILKDDEVVPLGAALALYDPFTGSGTSAVSSAQLVQSGDLDSAHFWGRESNPYLHLLASAKLQLLQDPPSDFITFAGTVVAEALAPKARKAPIPDLSTFRRPEYFDTERLHRLLALKAAIQRCSEPGDQLATLARVCLAAAIEPSSNLRRDGRTLRYAPNKSVSDPIKQFIEVAEKVHEDSPAHRTEITGKILLEDSRSSNPDSAELGKVDLAVFSPPYPNNIDYTEVYKLEAWLLGLIEDQTQFAAQRRRTMRSHGSLTWDDDYEFERSAALAQMSSLLDPLLGAIPAGDRYYQKRRQLVLGYADDMRRVIQSIYDRLRVGGVMACVVGNSLHGRPPNQILIAADLLIATIADMCGFVVTRLEVARYPSRRRTESAFLRESVVFARKGVG